MRDFLDIFRNQSVSRRKSLAFKANPTPFCRLSNLCFFYLVTFKASFPLQKVMDSICPGTGSVCPAEIGATLQCSTWTPVAGS